MAETKELQKQKSVHLFDGNEDNEDDKEGEAEKVEKAEAHYNKAQVQKANQLTEREKQLVDNALSPDNDEPLNFDHLSEPLKEYFISKITSEHLKTIQRKGEKYGLAPLNTTLTFRNIFYKKDGVMRLQAVSGFVKPYMMVCVLGAPDSGITTLFEVLTGRQKGGVVTGEMLVNGVPRDESFNKLIGFITKDDTNLPTLTVKETLLFSVRLRSPYQIMDLIKQLRVEVALKLLGLRHVANTIVGNQTIRGISGGEKRRLSIGCEIVAGHSIIIADLPTNGLDSASAYSTLMNTRHAVDGGRGYMCSLVQPSPQLLEIFDLIMLMSKGACIYFGSVNEIVPYLQSIGFHRPPGKSVPDFLEEMSGHPENFYVGESPRRLLQLTNSDEKGKPSSIEMKIVTHPSSANTPSGQTDATGINARVSNTKAMQILVKEYRHSAQYKKLGQEFWNDDPVFFDKRKKSRLQSYHTGLFYQIWLCIIRQFTVTARNLSAVLGNFIRNIVIGVLIGTLFYDMGLYQKDARTRFGLIFFMCSFNAMGAVQSIPILLEQRAVYYNQVNAGYFRGVAYYIGFMSVQIPQAALEVFVFVVLVYPMCGLAQGINSPEFGYAYLTLLVLNLTARVWCLFMASASPNQTVAQSLTPITFVLFSIFCGYLIPKASIPDGWIWLYYISMYTYSLKGLLVNELAYLKFTCADDEWKRVGGNAICPLQYGNPDVLKLYAMDVTDPNEKWKLLLYLFFFFLAFNLLAILALLLLNYSATDSAEISELNLTEEDKKEFEMIVDKDEERQWVGEDEKVVGAYISFKELSYAVDKPNGCCKGSSRKSLLSNTFGYCKPGMMVALMGPSGAGKSTLLDVLANKKTGGYTTGTLKINGKPRDVTFSRIAGYVEQSDSHDELATVREAIEFSALLRLPSHLSFAQKMLRVETVIQQLGLGHVQNRRIGNFETGGISPELRKKVTIAVELVMNPSLLFLDEPTTGLDSAGALAVMETVQTLSRQISVICTIHQPSAEIMEKFSHLLLLKAPGEVVYFGPLNELSSFFGSIGLGECSPGKNIADFALLAISPANVEEKKLENPAVLFAKSDRYKKIMAEIDLGIVPDDMEGKFVKFDSMTATSIPVQFYHLLIRFLKDKIRDRAFMRSRYLSSIFLALVFGSLYYQMGLSQADAANRISLIFLVVLFAFFSTQATIPAVVSQRPLYFRETQSNMYTALPFWFSRTVSDIPFVIFDSLVFCSILYWLCGFVNPDNGMHYALFMAAFFFTRFAGFSFTELMANVCPTAEIATALCTVLLTLFMLFCGFLVQKQNIPQGWIWMYYLSFFRYPINFMAINEYEGLTFYCDPGQLVCSFSKGEDVLNQFSATDKVAMFYSLVIFVFGYRVLSYLALRFISHIKR